jgi:hypothetical protein
VSNETPKRMVDIDLFIHPKMRPVRALAKALFVYLLCPSVAGINRLSIRQMRMEVDEQETDEAVEQALAQLCEVGVVRWDPHYEVVASPKIGKHVRTHLRTLPPSPLVDKFVSYYSDWLSRAGVTESSGAVSQVELSQPSQAPEPRALRIVDSTPDPDPVEGGCPIPIPYRISETETETEPEKSRGEVAGSQSRDRAAAERTSASPPGSRLADRGRVEDDVRQALIDAKVLLNPPLTYMAPIVERVLDGEATIPDVLSVLVEWKRRRNAGDNVQPASAAALFHRGKRWYRTEVEYLGRRPASRATGSGIRGSAGLPGLAEHYRRQAAEAAREPEYVPTPEDDAYNAACLAAFKAAGQRGGG